MKSVHIYNIKQLTLFFIQIRMKLGDSIPKEAADWEKKERGTKQKTVGKLQSREILVPHKMGAIKVYKTLFLRSYLDNLLKSP